MPKNSVDFLISSPPFKDSSETDKRRKSKYDIEGEYYEWYDKFMAMAEKVTKDYALIFNSSTRMIDIIRRYQEPFRVLVWTKGVSQYSYRYEPIFVYKFDADYSLNTCLWTDVFPFQAVYGSKKVHPYENPLELYLMLIKMLPKDKIIFDPCCGSGKTLIAAKLLNRSFIGMDIDPQCVEITNNGLNQGNLTSFLLESNL